MRNPVKVVLLLSWVIIFSMILSGCSENSPLEKVKAIFVSDAEKSGPSDTEVLASALRADNDCSGSVVQRDKQTDDGAFPVRVRISCNDGTVGEHTYHCKQVRNESGNDAWSCSKI